MSASSPSLQVLAFATLFLVGPGPAFAQETKDDDPILDPETIEDVDRQIDGSDSELLPAEDEEGTGRNTDLWEDYQRYRRDSEVDLDRDYKTSGERVNFGDDVTVFDGERIVGDVVSIGGDAIIHGRVEGDVVSVGGSVILHEGAYVDGEVVSVGGRVDERGTVEVTGDTVSIDLGFRLFPKAWRHADWSFPSPHYVSFGFELAVLAVGLLIGLIFYAVASKRLEGVCRRIETEPGQSFLIGLLGALGTPIAFVLAVILLAITIIGVLLIPVILVVLAVMILGGFFAVSLAVGRRLAHFRESGELQVARSPYFYLFLGYIALFAVDLLGTLFGLGGGLLHPLSLMLGIVGFFILMFASILGYGALITSRFGTQPVPVTPVAWQASSGMPPPPPPGSVPPPPPPGSMPPPPPPSAGPGAPREAPPAEPPPEEPPRGDEEKPST